MLTSDFNGDGWCDYALGIAYPFNSQMKAYSLDQLMVLGRESGWAEVLHGKRWASPSLYSYANEIWPIFQTDLTQISLAYPKISGPPYVLGIFAGGKGEGKESVGGSSCRQYISVHRWDDTVGAFKRVDDQTRDVVLKYFYAEIEKPCPVSQRLALPDSRHSQPRSIQQTPADALPTRMLAQ